MKELIESELRNAAQVLEKFMAEPGTSTTIEAAATLMAKCVEDGHKILACGNGGSMCDAMHFAEELTGRYRQHRPAIPAIAIADQGHLSCVGNDYGYEEVFSRYVQALGKEGDVLLAISTSGQSANIIKAVEAARAAKLKVILLTGKDGGQLAGTGEVEIRVPHFGFADRIQEVHIKVIHIFILLIEKKLGY